jgi:L-fuculose-phosphate aldolase
MSEPLIEQPLREQICLIGQLMHRNQYIDGASGNISARLDSERFLTTPSGLAKGFMTPDQLIIVDMDGVVLSAGDGLRPTSEIVMHLECYRQRPDVGGVVHAHPATAIALTVAGISLAQVLIPEMVISLGIVPTLPYMTPAGDDNRRLIAEAIREHDALLLALHGSLTAAKSVWEAYLRLESLEHAARIVYRVAQLGGARHTLSGEQVEKLLAIRAKLGLLRPGDAERFKAALESPQ